MNVQCVHGFDLNHSKNELRHFVSYYCASNNTTWI